MPKSTAGQSTKHTDKAGTMPMHSTPIGHRNIPKDLLDRILDEYPDMIKNEVKARMRDLQNEQVDHIRDDTKKVRMEIAMRAMQGLIPDHITSKNCYQRVAQMSVNYADALIVELEKTK